MTKFYTVGVRALVSLSLIAALLTGCTLMQEPPVPTATVTPTTQPSPTPEPTVTLTPSPQPTPTPFVSLLPFALAQGEGGAYVREQPNTLFPVVRTVNSTAPWTALGRTADNQWVQVQFDDGFTGWMVNQPTVPPLNIDALPITGESVLYDRIALVNAASLPFYNETGDTVQGDLSQNSALSLDFRSTDNAWLHGIDSQGRTGWVASSGIVLTFDGAALPTRDFMVLVAPQPEPQARVRGGAGGLRLRQAPDFNSVVLLSLREGAELTVTERTADNAWLLVELREGYRGWVSSAYVELVSITLDQVQASANPQPVAYFVPPTPEGAPAVTVINGGARQIFQTGQQMGNRANVFTTVGDSLTDTPYFLRGLISGYDLGQYGYLLPVIEYFNTDTGQGNAFARRAISTQAGWSTFSVVVEDRPELAGTCNPGELALACEYRLTRPAYALVMIGTNDAPAFGADTYRANMTRIIEISIAHGVVPILSTLPPRAEFNDRIIEYNAVIIQLAQQYGVPLTDLYSALIGLPNRGLDSDGIHLSIPPGAPATTLIFSADNLKYGTTMRNLTTLQALDQVRNLVG